MIHEILAALTLSIFHDMADRTPSEAAQTFLGLSPALRGCAILRGSEVLAATGADEAWGSAATALFGAADEAAGEEAVHAHVATEDGEAYAVRSSGLEMVAVTDRFTLASLVFADMRAALRTVSA